MQKTAAQEAYGRYKVAPGMLYDAYGNPVSQSSSILPMLLGGGLGVGGAHMLPNEKAKALRELADTATKDKFRKFYGRKAFAANAPRLLKGLGAGALGGYLLHKYLE